LSFGLAPPVAIHWAYQVFINSMHMVGEFDFHSVLQAAKEDASATADDIVSGYDLDFGF
jgi:uncharacterized membrane protein YjgN (DUF898 family)